MWRLGLSSLSPTSSVTFEGALGFTVEHKHVHELLDASNKNFKFIYLKPMELIFVISNYYNYICTVILFIFKSNNEIFIALPGWFS